jgi:hypothetical protein
MLNIIDTYKKLRSSIEVLSYSPLIGNLVLSDENIQLIKLGVNFKIVRDEIIVENKTLLSSKLTTTDLIATITILTKTNPGLEDVYISESEEKFFVQFSKYFKVPDKLYVHEIYSKENFDESIFIQKLRFVIKVREILFVISDYDKKLDESDEFFLYTTNPLIIKTSFSKYNFDENLKLSEKILDLIKSDFRSEVYISFLKIEIIKSLHGIEEADRFFSLLNNFKTVYINFNNSSLLYFKEFDFQKSKIEIQNGKIELLKKLHNVINDIAAKLITIPAAYLLILAALKFKDPISVINSIYLFSAIMYCLVIESSISNQFFYLKTLNKDIDEFVNHDLKKGKLVKIFERYKTELTDSYSIQKKILWLIRIVLWLLPIALITLLAYAIVLH